MPYHKTGTMDPPSDQTGNANDVDKQARERTTFRSGVRDTSLLWMVKPLRNLRQEQASLLTIE